MKVIKPSDVDIKKLVDYEVQLQRAMLTNAPSSIINRFRFNVR